MILKSPTHGVRVSTLRDLLPDARYILIMRDPVTNFESVARMWKKMFESYAIGPILSDDEIREAVLVDRPCFEKKLAAGTADLPANRFAEVAYESLAANPVEVIEQLYERLDLGTFDRIRELLVAEMKRRSGYRAKGSLPSAAWQERIKAEWSDIVAQHASLRSRAVFSPRTVSN